MLRSIKTSWYFLHWSINNALSSCAIPTRKVGCNTSPACSVPLSHCTPSQAHFCPSLFCCQLIYIIIILSVLFISLSSYLLFSLYHFHPNCPFPYIILILNVLFLIVHSISSFLYIILILTVLSLYNCHSICSFPYIIVIPFVLSPVWFML